MMTDHNLIQRIAIVLCQAARTATADEARAAESDRMAFDAIVDLYRQERRALVWDHTCSAKPVPGLMNYCIRCGRRLGIDMRRRYCSALCRQLQADGK